MSASGTTELIWHFAGYLRLPDFDYGTPTIIYQGQPTGLGPDETSDGPLHHLRILSESPYPDLRVGSVTLSESPYVPWHVRPVHDPSYLAYPHVHLPHSHDHHSPPNHGQDDSTAGGGEFTITTQFSYTATYQPGGDQELIDVRQINMMTNNNVVDNHDINAPLSVVLANDAHAASELATMLNAASDAPGQEFLPVGADTQQLISLVNNNDAHLAAVEAQFAPYQVQPGVYVNGELYTGSADPHQVTIDALNAVSTALNNGLAGPPAPPTGDGHDLSNQTVNVGSDITANDAVLANLEGATVSLAVAGNFYQTQEIVQTNVFQEFDHISGSSAPLATVSVAPNTVQNIADIQEQTPTLTSGGEGTTPTGLNWSVSVLNG